MSNVVPMSPSAAEDDAAKTCVATQARALALFTTRELTLYFLKLGTLGFGGPVALAGYMQKDLVEERRWFSREDYLEGLALAQLAPARSQRSWRSILAGSAAAYLARR